MIYCIIGGSGTGKSYLTKHLNMPAICTYTTRPMRAGEINGVDHNFISTETFESLVANDAIMACTTYGVYDYATPSSLDYPYDVSVVVDETGFWQIQQRCGKLAVPIVLLTEQEADEERKARDPELSRELLAVATILRTREEVSKFIEEHN